MAEMAAAGNDYSSILASMQELGSELSQYNQNISNLQIVMDSGVLVGEISPGVDRNLGRSATLTARGVL